MTRGKRTLKLYHGIILAVLAAGDIFIFSRYLGRWFGFYGTLVSELMLLLLAVGTAAVAGGDFRKIFPVRKPRACQVFGTLVMWLGTLFATMVVTMILMLLFPRQMSEVSQGISASILSVPFLAAFVIVVISPAVCEEAVFRGVVFNSLFKAQRNKWIPIAVTAFVFGAFHGSIWRFFPTFFLGIAMGYLLMETGNIFYCVLFHGVNNFVSLCCSYILQSFTQMGGMDDLSTIMEESSALLEMPLYTAGQYLAFYGGSGIVLLYIGSYLIHKGQPGYDKGLFPREKQRTMLAIVVGAVSCVAVGMMLMAAGIALKGGIMRAFP